MILSNIISYLDILVCEVPFQILYLFLKVRVFVSEEFLYVYHFSLQTVMRKTIHPHKVEWSRLGSWPLGSNKLFAAPPDSLRVKEQRLNTVKMLKILEDLVKVGWSNGSLIALQRKGIAWGKK